MADNCLAEIAVRPLAEISGIDEQSAPSSRFSREPFDGSMSAETSRSGTKRTERAERSRWPFNGSYNNPPSDTRAAADRREHYPSIRARFSRDDYTSRARVFGNPRNVVNGLRRINETGLYSFTPDALRISRRNL